MKYLFFFAAMAGIAPMVMLLVCNRLCVRWAVFALLMPLLAFNSTAINFYSHELYRGTSRGMEISLIYIIAVGLLISLVLRRGWIRWVPGWGARIYLLYFLASIPSITNAANGLFSFFELWKMVMIYLVFLAVYNYLDYSKGDFDIILNAVAVIIAVNFLTIVRQHFQGYYQVRALFPHQNSLAMFMMMAGLLFFSRSFNYQEGLKGLLYFGIFLLASATLFRTYSRGAIFCYPLAGMVTMFCSFLKGISPRKVLLTGMIMVVGLAGMLIFLPRVIQRFLNAPESSGQTRKDLARAAVNMMEDHPFAGVGLNNWGIKINPPYDYSRHRDARRGQSEDYKDGIVETIYLLVGAECGIPCLLILLSWFGFYWLSAFRLMWTLRRSRFFYLPAGIFGALSGAFLQSTLEWILKQQINFMWMMVLFAILSYLNCNHRELIRLENIPTQQEPI
ncbi:MAG: O-antigen ligase family protein [Lentisphaeria bacterium]|nr:O-antigen ligase family protein [Lentisphaeria bacterium]